MRLAEEFGTSQMPIREALRDLEMAGLVTAKPRRGSFVKPFATSAQREIYLVRVALEEASARLATVNPALDVETLQSEVDLMRDAARSKDIEQMIRHSVFFFFSSRRRHTRFDCDWSSDVCSSDLGRRRGCSPASAPGSARSRP